MSSIFQAKNISLESKSANHNMNTFQLCLDDHMNNKEILILNVYDFPLFLNQKRERIGFLYVMINNTIMKYENKEKY